jgi:hypothetical protein
MVILPLGLSYFFFLKGSAAARPTANTNLANGSVVFDFFLEGADFLTGEYDVDAFFGAGEYAVDAPFAGLSGTKVEPT